MQVGTTKRGFALTEFEDYWGAKCSLQKSSNAERECIWLGVDTPPAHMREFYGRMHLTRDTVEELLPHLIEFAATGHFGINKPKAPRKRYRKYKGI